MAIREAKIADLAKITQMYTRLTAEMAQLAPTIIRPAPADPEYFRDYLEDDAACIFLAESDQQVVGMALVVAAQTGASPEIVQHQFAYLIDLFVEKPNRGQGLGKSLLQAVQAFAKGRKLNSLQLNMLWADAGAYAFYQKCGFHLTTATLEKPLTDLNRR